MNRSAAAKTNLNFPWVTILIAGLVGLIGVLTLLTKDASAQPEPFQSCDPLGYLFQYPGGDTHVYEVDLATGNFDEVSGSPISGTEINAIGYRMQDNFIYGWNNEAGARGIVRVGSNLDIESLGVPVDGTGGSAPALDADHSVVIGDFGPDGFYWIIAHDGMGSENAWYQIDITTSPSPTIVDGAAIDTSPANPALNGRAGGADWSFVPGTNSLFRILHDSPGPGTESFVARFDMTAHTWHDMGSVGALGDNTFGATYADPNYLYGADNGTGEIWRINVKATPPLSSANADLFAQGDPSATNDGARCANATIAIDFGDAPSSYGTLLNDTLSGARHQTVINIANNTAPLMLGKKIDTESDGFPGPLANGDDLNNIDDEDGVQHIVATPGTPTALSVPVTVTNNSPTTVTLAGWIDLDGNGTFDAGERVTAAVPANSGTRVYELNFPETTFTDNTYARFRVFSSSDQSEAAQNLLPTGPASGGEVEDYLVQVGTYQVEKTSTPPNGSTVKPGDTVTYTLNITNTGLTDLINLTIHDDLSDVLDDATFEGTPVVSPASAGTAVLDNDELEFVFTGDILTGQQVTITYSVKVNDPDTGNHIIKNHVIAAHSNCHPGVVDGQHTVPDDPACQTTHVVAGLADTGANIILLTALGAGLLATPLMIRIYWRSKVQ